MTPPTRNQPKTLAPSATAQHTAQVLAIAPHLLAEMRNTYSLSSPCLSLLYACRAIQVDKAGYYNMEEVIRLCGLPQRKGTGHFNELEAAGYVQRIGGTTTKRLQNWQLTPTGWALAGDAIQRTASALSPLLNKLGQRST
jgi:DNA-binding MarR family transcriptional regulator